MSAAADRPPGSLRRRLTQIVQGLPGALPELIWEGRRRSARIARHTREWRGDYSRSHPANHEMDLRLDARFGHQRDGFFVEAGACDGFYESNTYFLERARGWSGLLIEPTPVFARAARRARRGADVVQCALVPDGFAEEFVELRFGGSMTVIEDEGAPAWVSAVKEGIALDKPEHVYRAPARTLSEVLDAASAPEVDLLSLDVEGFEAEVLDGLDFARHAPRFMLIEVDQRAPRSRVEERVADYYVPVDELSAHDVLYERRA